MPYYYSTPPSHNVILYSPSMSPPEPNLHPNLLSIHDQILLRSKPNEPLIPISSSQSPSMSPPEPNLHPNLLSIHDQITLRFKPNEPPIPISSSQYPHIPPISSRTVITSDNTYLNYSNTQYPQNSITHPNPLSNQKALDNRNSIHLSFQPEIPMEP